MSRFNYRNSISVQNTKRECVDAAEKALATISKAFRQALTTLHS